MFNAFSFIQKLSAAYFPHFPELTFQRRGFKVCRYNSFIVRALIFHFISFESNLLLFRFLFFDSERKQNFLSFSLSHKYCLGPLLPRLSLTCAKVGVSIGWEAWLGT
jgi:hypothetical protein